MAWNNIYQRSLNRIAPGSSPLACLCSFWRFGMISGKTVAMPTQNTRWITFPAWHGLEKKVKLVGRCCQGHEIFRKVLTCSTLGYWKCRCYPPPLMQVIYENRGGPSNPLQVYGLNSPEKYINVILIASLQWAWVTYVIILNYIFGIC